MKYLGAFKGNPILYNIFRQNRQFRLCGFLTPSCSRLFTTAIFVYPVVIY